MIEVVWHGRGGQGAFTAARLLGEAFVLGGDHRFALAFPSFGPERRGAPVRAFTKLDEKPIGDRSQIQKADAVIFLDDTLLTEDADSELKENGIILVNTKRQFRDARVISIDADQLAQRILGRPITNTAMLGALLSTLPQIGESEVRAAVSRGMPPALQERNFEIIKAAGVLAAAEHLGRTRTRKEET